MHVYIKSKIDATKKTKRCTTILLFIFNLLKIKKNDIFSVKNKDNYDNFQS